MRENKLLLSSGCTTSY